MEKIYAGARALAVVVAVFSGFIEIPYGATLLLVLGGLSAINEENTKTYLTAIVLVFAAAALEAIPGIGTTLSAIFGGIGTAALGGSIVAVTLSILMRIKSDWMK